MDTISKKVEMSFRNGTLFVGRTSFFTISDLHEGQKVFGVIRKVEEYGLFIRLDGSKISGLCHKSEVVSSLQIEGRLIYHVTSSAIMRPLTLRLPFVIFTKAIT